jgi:hypothetical protein
VVSFFRNTHKASQSTSFSSPTCHTSILSPINVLKILRIFSGQLITAIRPLYLPLHLVLRHPCLFSSFKVRYRVSGTYLTEVNL